MTTIVIVGAGGQGLVVAEMLLRSAPDDRLRVAAFVDDRPSLTGSRVLGIPVCGTSDDLERTPHDALVIAIGDNARREAVTRRLERRGERVVSAVHPFSSIGLDVDVGAGTMISAGVVLVPGVRIGGGVLLNTRCSIDHQSQVGDFAHVAPGATVGAMATIGERALIGTGASVMSGRTVGADAIVGAGALVTRDVPAGMVAVGVPARVVRRA